MSFPDLTQWNEFPVTVFLAYTNEVVRTLDAADLTRYQQMRRRMVMTPKPHFLLPKGNNVAPICFLAHSGEVIGY